MQVIDQEINRWRSSIALALAESSQVGQARRTAVALANTLGFDEARQGVLALIVTEAASNVIRHAKSGEILLRSVQGDGNVGVEILALDRGPGITNIGKCLQDGYSTAGTPGNGLGAISRLADAFDIYSMPGEGVVLLASVWEKPLMERQAQACYGGKPEVEAASSHERTRPSGMKISDIGVINRAKPGQEVCGDAWAVEKRPGRQLYLLADGLGHGPEAAWASQEAVRVFRRHANESSTSILTAIHAALHATRGVAAAVAEVDLARAQVCYAGIGNISGTIVSPAQSQSMVSHNGILGHQMRKVQEFNYPWTQESLLILHSDGLSNRWQLSRYAGLFVRPTALIAGTLYRDHQRANDDATILVGRIPTRRASQE